jgi:hypothetical protein
LGGRKKRKYFAAELLKTGWERWEDERAGRSRWRCGLGIGGGSNFWVASCWVLCSTRYTLSAKLLGDSVTGCCQPRGGGAALLETSSDSEYERECIYSLLFIINTGDLIYSRQSIFH